MKQVALLAAAVLCSFFCRGQHDVPLRNLWAVPHVHVLFDGYTVSFTIKDINRAIQILTEADDSTYGVTSGLDTAKEYTVELYTGYNTAYRNDLQPLLQRGVGAYLLSVGHADIENPRHKKVKAIVMDAQAYEGGDNITDVKFYDARTGKLLFNGLLPAGLYRKDIGIE